MTEFKWWWDNIGSGIIPKDGDDMEEHARRVCFEYALYLHDGEISGERSYNADGTLPLQPEPDF